MRILQNHSDFIEYTPIEKEIKSAEETEKKTVRYKDLIILLTSIGRLILLKNCVIAW